MQPFKHFLQQISGTASHFLQKG